jgi:hypothetical protein
MSYVRVHHHKLFSRKLCAMGGFQKILVCVVFILTMWFSVEMRYLTSETIQGAALPLEGIHNVHSCDRLSPCVLGVSDRVTDNILEEDLEDSTGLFVNQTRDTFDTPTTSQTTDSGLGNTLDVITKDFAMTLSASLSKSFSSFSSARHLDAFALFLKSFDLRG